MFALTIECWAFGSLCCEVEGEKVVGYLLCVGRGIVSLSFMIGQDICVVDGLGAGWGD